MSDADFMQAVEAASWINLLIYTPLVIFGWEIGKRQLKRLIKEWRNKP